MWDSDCYFDHRKWIRSYIMSKARLYQKRIDDKRLNKDMDRIRSGKLQKFYKGRCGDPILFTIEPPKQEMYTSLIDGKWYWVKGCSKCKDSMNFGDKFSYQVCKERDVCQRCNTHRDDIEDTVWMTPDGFMCKPCNTLEQKEIKRTALKKVEENGYCEYDYMNTDEVFCPHCGSDQQLADELSSSSDGHVCDVCGGKFDIEVEYTITYTTTTVGERITN